MEIMYTKKTQKNSAASRKSAFQGLIVKRSFPLFAKKCETKPFG